MANSLRQILNERGVTKPISLELPVLSPVVEKELAGIYNQFLQTISASLLEDVVRGYKQSLLVRDNLESVLRGIDKKTVQATLTFSKRWSAWAKAATRMHYKTLIRKLKYSTGVSLATSMGVAGDEATMEDLLTWNTELIRGISEEMRQKIAASVFAGLTARTPVTQIAKEISEATGMARARARRIASDQTVKLNSALDAQRLKDLGCEGYQWMHSRKLHPRLEHKARDGDFIKFGSTIDKTDPPGHAPFCGCKRKMVL